MRGRNVRTFQLSHMKVYFHIGGLTDEPSIKSNQRVGIISRANVTRWSFILFTSTSFTRPIECMKMSSNTHYEPIIEYELKDPDFQYPFERFIC
jgi:hypothetical protein